MARYFLATVGVLYAALGVWCALLPEKTSKSVGFVVQPGQGQSEFLAVYGGLEVGLGLFFLWPVLRGADVAGPLLACVLVHAGLVVFRTIGFFRYTGFSTTTYVLAGTEWVLLLAAGALYLRA